MHFYLKLLHIKVLIYVIHSHFKEKNIVWRPSKRSTIRFFFISLMSFKVILKTITNEDNQLENVEVMKDGRLNEIDHMLLHYY